MLSLKWREVGRISNEVGGNALITFALAIPLVFGMAGAALDFSRMEAAKLSARNALDAALLAAARLEVLDEDRVDATVQAYFARHGVAKHNATIVDIHGTVENSSTLKGVANVKMPTTLLNILGLSELRTHVEAKVVRGLGNVEIALVLDTTASMEGSRLSSVKTDHALRQRNPMRYASP